MQEDYQFAGLLPKHKSNGGTPHNANMRSHGIEALDVGGALYK